MEEWKDIKGYEGLYKVSNKGRVKSVERKVWNSGNQSYNTIKERILKPLNNRDGYVKVRLCKDGKCRTYLIHRLVANAFIPNPNEYKEVNHIDENKTNNSIDNLEWCNGKYNCNHGSRNKRVALSLSKPILGISLDGKSYLYFNSTRDAARLGGFNQGHVAACCRGELKTHKGYTWMYADSQE